MQVLEQTLIRYLECVPKRRPILYLAVVHCLVQIHSVKELVPLISRQLRSQHPQHHLNLLSLLRTDLSKHHSVLLGKVLRCFQIHLLTPQVCLVSNQKLDHRLVLSHSILDPLKAFLIAVHKERSVVKVPFSLCDLKAQEHVTASLYIIKLNCTAVPIFLRTACICKLKRPYKSVLTDAGRA